MSQFVDMIAQCEVSRERVCCGIMVGKKMRQLLFDILPDLKDGDSL